MPCLSPAHVSLWSVHALFESSMHLSVKCSCPVWVQPMSLCEVFMPHLSPACVSVWSVHALFESSLCLTVKCSCPIWVQHVSLCEVFMPCSSPAYVSLWNVHAPFESNMCLCAKCSCPVRVQRMSLCEMFMPHLSPACVSVWSVHALFESSMCPSVVVGTWQAQRKATFTNAHAPTTNSTWRLTQDTRSVLMNVISSSASFKDDNHVCWWHSSLCVTMLHKAGFEFHGHGWWRVLWQSQCSRICT